MTTIKRRPWFSRLQTPPSTAYDHDHPSRDAVDMEERHVQAQSLIGGTAAALHNTRQHFRNQEAILQAEVTAKTEALRQVRASAAAVDAALAMIADDEALTPEERAAIGGSAVTESISEAAGRALEEALSDGN